MTSLTLRPSGIGTRRLRAKASGDGPLGRGAPAAPPVLLSGLRASDRPEVGHGNRDGRLGEYSSDDVEDRHMCCSWWRSDARHVFRVVDSPCDRPVYIGASSLMPEPLIRMTDVVKTYDTGEVPFTALRGIDLDVDAGEFIGLIGKSGSGKTTLINMITGIDRPSSGTVLIGGTPVHKLNENQLAVWRGKTIGVVFQFFQLLPTLTVAENVMLPMDFCNVYTTAERPERALHLLEQVEMADQADKLPSALSGGQQQRVAIARALANDPPILAADEPTGNLDSKTADSVFSLFERLVDDGKTIIMVTHDSDIAARVRRSLHVSDGEIVEERLNTLNALMAEGLV